MDDRASETKIPVAHLPEVKAFICTGFHELQSRCEDGEERIKLSPDEDQGMEKEKEKREGGLP